MMTDSLPRFATGLWFLLTLVLVSCAGELESLTPPPTPTPFPPDIYIGLSDSAAPLAELVSRRYETATGRSAPIFLEGSDDTLLGDLDQGIIEAAIVLQLPADSQFWFNPVALDGVVMIVHPDLPADNMTSSQLKSILSGSISNWAEIGGPDLAINVLNREPGAGARTVLQQRVMGNARFSNLAEVAAADDYMRQEVQTNPGTIGYTMMASAEGQSIRLDGHAATPETVTDQSYPLTTPIYFAAQDEPVGPLRDFLAWVQSSDGQAVIGEKYGRVR